MSATRWAGTIVVAAILSLNAGSSFSDDAATEETSMGTIVPIAIASSYLEGRGLVAADLSESDPNDSNVVSDEPIENSSHIFHTGKIMVGVYEAAPGKVHIDNAKYDEFVQILEGRLILTPDGGDESYEYKTGDSFVVPKGYTGTWHMPEKYRELIVIDTSYLESD